MGHASQTFINWMAPWTLDSASLLSITFCVVLCDLLAGSKTLEHGVSSEENLSTDSVHGLDHRCVDPLATAITVVWPRLGRLRRTRRFSAISSSFFSKLLYYATSSTSISTCSIFHGHFYQDSSTSHEDCRTRAIWFAQWHTRVCLWIVGWSNTTATSRSLSTHVYLCNWWCDQRRYTNYQTTTTETITSDAVTYQTRPEIQCDTRTEQWCYLLEHKSKWIQRVLL